MLGAAHLLARLHREAGDPSAARRVLEEALAAGERRRPDADPLMLALAFELATLAEELGNRHEARRNFRRLVTAGLDVLGTDHPAVREARAYLDDAGTSPARETSMRPPVLPGHPTSGSVAAPVADGRLTEELFPPGTSPAQDDSPDDSGHPVPHWPPVGSAHGTHGTHGSSGSHHQAWPQGLGCLSGSIGARPVPEASGADPVPEPGTAQGGDRRAAADAVLADTPPSTDARVDPASRPSPTGRGAATSGLPQASSPHLGEPALRPGSARQPGLAPRTGSDRRPGPGPRPGAHPELDPHATPAPHPEYDPVRTFAGAPSIARPPGGTSSADPGRRPTPRDRNRTAVIAVVAAAGVAAAVAGAGAVVLLRNAPTAPLVSPTPGTSTAGPPSEAPPTDLRLRDDSTSITLTWTDPSGGTVPFVVAAGRAGQQLSPQDSVDPGRTSYTINGLSSRLDYCFTVLAVYSTDSFATSGQVCTDREG